MTTILEALKYADDLIHGGNPQDANIANDWEHNGFKTGEECEPWWAAGCFDAGSAAELRDAGIAARDMSMMYSAYGSGYSLGGASLGYQHSNEDMDLYAIRKVLSDN